ncbi:hypothetical protein ACFLQI_01545 [Candidatus Undinarchaeota archaeon]
MAEKVKYNGNWMSKEDALQKFEHDKNNLPYRGLSINCGKCGYVWEVKKAIGLPAKCPKCNASFDLSLENSGLLDESPIVVKKTRQYSIFKESLEKFLKEGVAGDGFIIFDLNEPKKPFQSKKQNLSFVQFALEKTGIMLGFTKEDKFDALCELLNSLSFKESTERENVGLHRMEYDVSDFVYAQCGRDVDLAAYLTDRIFRDIFNLDDEYEIKASMCPDGYEDYEMEFETESEEIDVWECDYCDKEFDTQAKAEKHEATCGEVWSCDYCHKSFDTQAKAEKHEKTCVKKKSKK